MRKLFAIERGFPDFRCLEDSAEHEAALKIIAASRLEKFVLSWKSLPNGCESKTACPRANSEE
ncbi:MAG: hypothetical protein GY811_24935, partial [Myxococcales bacterium]|nr:hypothetical protein [Myxococcales bacterium]